MLKELYEIIAAGARKQMGRSAASSMSWRASLLRVISARSQWTTRLAECAARMMDIAQIT